MAILTDNGRLAVMEMDDYWEPALPLSPGTLGQDDQQQLLWGFPEILWGAPVALVYGVPCMEAGMIEVPGFEAGMIEVPGF